MPTIALLGTLDTKGDEYAFVAESIRAQGRRAWLIDVGTGGPPSVAPDVTREEVAAAAGLDLGPLLARRDRGECVAAMASAAPLFVQRAFEQGSFDGIVALGGGGGTAIASAAMRTLPVGVPKLLVSTLASGNTAPYIGTTDITLMPSVVDFAGLNRISRAILTRAAGAICGMVSVTPPPSQDRPIIAASMFGNTTPCINATRPLLEAAGYEVLTFHANGAGGKTMEALVQSGLVSGVLDVTTTELADELVGGVLTAGPDRLNAAARAKIPAVVAPGCLDMVNFGEPATVPPRFADRKFYAHNPQVTLMRTTPEECLRLGCWLAEKVNAYPAPVTVLLPLRGISMISAPNGPFYDPAADSALFGALTTHLRPEIPVISLACSINDPPFVEAAVASLLANIRQAANQDGLVP